MVSVRFIQDSDGGNCNFDLGPLPGFEVLLSRLETKLQLAEFRVEFPAGIRIVKIQSRTWTVVVANTIDSVVPMIDCLMLSPIVNDYDEVLDIDMYVRTCWTTIVALGCVQTAVSIGFAVTLIDSPEFVPLIFPRLLQVLRSERKFKNEAVMHALADEQFSSIPLLFSFGMSWRDCDPEECVNSISESICIAVSKGSSNELKNGSLCPELSPAVSIFFELRPPLLKCKRLNAVADEDEELFDIPSLSDPLEPLSPLSISLIPFTCAFNTFVFICAIVGGFENVDSAELIAFRLPKLFILLLLVPVVEA
uniref:Uncharacterized protein n=1 Tax=Glossina brevipalpis TaxID=37001 RepID=A0A1A9W2G2_9MUSC